MNKAIAKAKVPTEERTDGAPSWTDTLFDYEESMAEYGKICERFYAEQRAKAAKKDGGV